MRNFLGRLRRSGSRSLVEQLATLTSVGDGSTLTLDFTTGVLDPRLTFTRNGGGTYIGNDGLVYGMDFATSSSLAIGTGSKSVTLTSTAGVDRRYLVGQTVYISNGANNMSGPVTAYNASTQVLTINATATSGSGSFTSWTVGNASARFDHDPTTLAPRGLLIEATAANIATNSNLQAGWLGGSNTTVTANTNEVTSPDGTNNAAKIALTNAGYCSRFESITGLANATTYTFSYWIRGTAGNQQRVYSVTQGTDLVTQSNLTYTSTGWTRVQITFTSGATNNNVYIYVASRPTGTVNDVLYIWGAQLEVGSGASSHIPTGASQGSRAADECSMTGTNFSSWFTNNSEGSLFVRYSMNNPSAFLGAGIDRYAYEISNSSGTSRVFCNASYRVTVAGDAGRFPRVFDLGTIDLAPSLVATAAQNTAFAWGYKSNDNHLAAVGVTANDTSGSLQTGLDRMHLGASRTFGSTTYLQGCISLLKYWPTRLPNATLQGLVS